MKKRTKGVLAAALAAAGVFLLAGLDARLLVRAYTVESGRLTGPVRLAVLTDLHACAYGEGQRELLDAVAEQSPDLVLLCGDIVDDEPRMPEARALDTVEALAAVWPTYYVTGNHEFWTGLTGYYKLSSDTVPIISDTTFWNKKRDIPLTKEEEKLYHVANNTNEQKIDSANITKYLKLTEKFTNTISMDYKTTRLKYSGIFNPFQLGYSGHNGITYRQRLRISKTFDKDRQLRFRPDVGFVFKRKEIFFTVSGDWEYLPEKKGILSLSIGNGNQSYSSAIMKEINEQLKDSTFNFDDLNLEYFKHYYAEIRNNIELFNGFQLWTGVSYHRRIPVKKKSDISNPGEGIEEIINDNYHDFTPVVGFSYTPRQYYWMDGYRKEYLYSYYPTISVEFARAIPGVGKSSGDYGRIEADIHQSIALGLSRKLNYHISGGIYLNPKSIYFADFRYFSRRQFPESWGDEFGGVFNQLRSFWFNASDKYVQGHIMYESPFILSQLFKKKTSKYILSERFYFSQLWTPVLPSYTEVGYGFGNHIFNVAAFAGFDRWKYQNIGLKFAFELF